MTGSSRPLLLITSLALAGLACRQSTQQASSVAADATFLPLGIVPAELPDYDSRGARLVAQYCSQCHGIPSPASHSAVDWVPTLRRMLVHVERGLHRDAMGGMMRRGMRMGMHAAVPTEDERRAILAYLQSHGLRAIAPDSLPEPGGEVSALFARTCSRCHALPSPLQHSAAEWPAVVVRMRCHTLRFGVDTINDEAAHEIIGYLRRVAGGVRPARTR